MLTTFDLLLVQHFQADVHLQFQQMGSKIGNTVQIKNNIIDPLPTFHKGW
jgi:hypothetical protein